MKNMDKIPELHFTKFNLNFYEPYLGIKNII